MGRPPKPAFRWHSLGRRGCAPGSGRHNVRVLLRMLQKVAYAGSSTAALASANGAGDPRPDCAQLHRAANTAQVGASGSFVPAAAPAAALLPAAGGTLPTTGALRWTQHGALHGATHGAHANCAVDAGAAAAAAILLPSAI